MDNFNVKEFLQFQTKRKITDLSKNVLNMLEDMRDDNIISIEEYSKKRKRILDLSNDSIRELFTHIDSVDFFLKNTEKEL